MFDDYRAWLESELRLLGNASHHAYSFGQANMAKRAIERFDEAMHEQARGATAPVTLSLGAEEARLALDALESSGGAHPALVVLRSRLAEALGRLEEKNSPPAAAFAEPLAPERLDGEEGGP